MPALTVGAELEKRYRIEAILGQGATSVVYRARSPQGKRVVVKEWTAPDAAWVERWQQEVTDLQSIQHRGFPRLLESFAANGCHYVVSEYIAGHGLDHLDRPDPPREREVLEWAMEIADLLGFMHSRVPARIMGDLKPKNVVLDTNGKIWLLDYGLARLAQPPEQASDARTDFYALGETIYTLVAGQPPPGPAPSLATVKPNTTPLTVKLVERLMAKDPADRPATATDVRVLLQESRADIVSEDTAQYLRPLMSTGVYPRQSPRTDRLRTALLGPEPEPPRPDPADEPWPRWLAYALLAGVVVALGLWFLHSQGRI